MEEKIFDLLEKIYIDVQETKKDVKVINGRLDGIDGLLDGIDGRLTKLELKVEHEISNKLDALFEFKDVAMQRFDIIDKKLDNLSDKVDSHDISIQVIQGGKNKKTI